MTAAAVCGAGRVWLLWSVEKCFHLDHLIRGCSLKKNPFPFILTTSPRARRWRRIGASSRLRTGFACHGAHLIGPSCASFSCMHTVSMQQML